MAPVNFLPFGLECCLLGLLRSPEPRFHPALPAKVAARTGRRSLCVYGLLDLAPMGSEDAESIEPDVVTLRSPSRKASEPPPGQSRFIFLLPLAGGLFCGSHGPISAAAGTLLDLSPFSILMVFMSLDG